MVVMSDRSGCCGGYGGFYKNDEILWFILLFLLLFCNNGFYGLFGSCGCGTGVVYKD